MKTCRKSCHSMTDNTRYLTLAVYVAVFLLRSCCCFVCRESGRFPDESVEGCRGYIFCRVSDDEQTLMVKFSCPQGSVFNRFQSKCESEQTYECPEYHRQSSERSLVTTIDDYENEASTNEYDDENNIDVDSHSVNYHTTETVAVNINKPEYIKFNNNFVRSSVIYGKAEDNIVDLISDIVTDVSEKLNEEHTTENVVKNHQNDAMYSNFIEQKNPSLVDGFNNASDFNNDIINNNDIITTTDIYYRNDFLNTSIDTQKRLNYTLIPSLEEEDYYNEVSDNFSEKILEETTTSTFEKLNISDKVIFDYYNDDDIRNTTILDSSEKLIHKLANIINEDNNDIISSIKLENKNTEKFQSETTEEMKKINDDDAETTTELQTTMLKKYDNSITTTDQYEIETTSNIIEISTITDQNEIRTNSNRSEITTITLDNIETTSDLTTKIISDETTTLYNANLITKNYTVDNDFSENTFETTTVTVNKIIHKNESVEEYEYDEENSSTVSNMMITEISDDTTTEYIANSTVKKSTQNNEVMKNAFQTTNISINEIFNTNDSLEEYYDEYDEENFTTTISGATNDKEIMTTIPAETTTLYSVNLISEVLKNTFETTTVSVNEIIYKNETLEEYEHDEQNSIAKSNGTIIEFSDDTFNIINSTAENFTQNNEVLRNDFENTNISTNKMFFINDSLEEYSYEYDEENFTTTTSGATNDKEIITTMPAETTTSYSVNLISEVLENTFETTTVNESEIFYKNESLEEYYDEYDGENSTTTTSSVTDDDKEIITTMSAKTTALYSVDLITTNPTVDNEVLENTFETTAVSVNEIFYKNESSEEYYDEYDEENSTTTVSSTTINKKITEISDETTTLHIVNPSTENVTFDNKSVESETNYTVLENSSLETTTIDTNEIIYQNESTEEYYDEYEENSTTTISTVPIDEELVTKISEETTINAITEYTTMNNEDSESKLENHINILENFTVINKDILNEINYKNESSEGYYDEYDDEENSTTTSSSYIDTEITTTTLYEPINLIMEHTTDKNEEIESKLGDDIVLDNDVSEISTVSNKEMLNENSYKNESSEEYYDEYDEEENSTTTLSLPIDTETTTSSYKSVTINLITKNTIEKNEEMESKLGNDIILDNDILETTTVSNKEILNEMSSKNESANEYYDEYDEEENSTNTISNLSIDEKIGVKFNNSQEFNRNNINLINMTNAINITDDIGTYSNKSIEYYEDEYYDDIAKDITSNISSTNKTSSSSEIDESEEYYEDYENVTSTEDFNETPISTTLFYEETSTENESKPSTISVEIENNVDTTETTEEYSIYKDITNDTKIEPTTVITTESTTKSVLDYTNNALNILSDNIEVTSETTTVAIVQPASSTLTSMTSISSTTTSSTTSTSSTTISTSLPSTAVTSKSSTTIPSTTPTSSTTIRPSMSTSLPTTTFSTSTTSISTTEPTIIKPICSTVGRYPDPSISHCKGYILCMKSSGGNLTQFNFICPQNTTFNSAIQQCTNKEYNCSVAVQLADVASSCSAVGRFSDPDVENCIGYVLCIRSVIGGFIKYKFTCGDDSAFDPLLRKCVKNYKCTSNIMTSTVVTNIQPGSTLATPSISDFQCTSPGRFSDFSVSGCKGYILCSGLIEGSYRKYHSLCPNKTYFNPISSTCDAKYSCDNDSATIIPNDLVANSSSKFICTTEGRFPDDTVPDCTNYVICQASNGKFVKYDFKCFNSMRFDPEVKSCSDSYTCSRSTKTSTTSTTSTTVRSTTQIASEKSFINSTNVSEEFTCVAQGRYEYDKHSNCKGYVICVKLATKKYVPYYYNCLGDMLFDPIAKNCTTTYECPLNLKSNTGNHKRFKRI